MLNKRNRPEINAGSMADIAFLLLVFFLVATTMDQDIGIQRKLNPTQEITSAPVPERNILTIMINSENRLLVDSEYLEVVELKSIAKRHIENNGKSNCAYCLGAKDPNSSDHPRKAIISIQNDRQSSYSLYVAVQNEITAAYSELRERESQKKYGKVFAEIGKQNQNTIKKLFPLLISEAEVNFNIAAR